VPPFTGSTTSTRARPFSTTSSDPSGWTSTDVGQANLNAGLRTVTDPSSDAEPPARAVNLQRPAAGNTSRARYEPFVLAARATTRPGPAAVTRISPRKDRGRTTSVAVHGCPTAGAVREPASETWTRVAADALQIATTSAQESTSNVRMSSSDQIWRFRLIYGEIAASVKSGCAR
jgi:hypothetical protein